MSEPVRCGWCGTDPLYVTYHDTEWGMPERDGRALWEKLILDGFQAGLAWITILRKREAFRSAFASFRPEVIAGWGEAEVQRLLADPSIIRHRGKIEGTIRGAQAYLRIEEREGFSNYMWRYVGGQPLRPRPATMSDIPAQTDLSARIAKDLKKEGFTFCGPTIVYAFMQATGMVNDHLVTCHCHDRIAALG
ncbi:DNA-3-methyladenine glycosylase I [Tabrizicola sp. J26]|uniref:DNA-3-methyladenine glycosylase I n=1 Tax=Alitabrizicola rongguiensis TaxID=2909234 RepID=UPI001F27B7B5|nr:DNA-3-methyladenine glycosylase I [Tabrizicola rongguiensis]MCF1708084.1 DNA-3-methyladenine glycosylase I [Tabrizicola rongguiensis]